MTSPAFKSAFATLLSASALVCCVTPQRALRNLDCDASVSHLVEHFLMNTWGIGSFACARLHTSSKEEERAVEAACKVARAPRTLTDYPARGNPMAPPPWWDLQLGERAEYASVRGPGNYWEGFVYVRRAATEATWFMCAGGD